MNVINIEKKTIHALFQVQAEKTPNKLAVSYRSVSLTYAELNRKSNQLARKLRNEGVKPNDIVALMMNRSVDILVAIFAILKAGGSYLPIDPSYPKDRIDYMLEDSGTELLLTQRELTNQISYDGRSLCVDDFSFYTGDSSALIQVNVPSDLVYLLYTSGSTGKPKGVMIEHESVCNFIEGVTSVIDFSEEKTIACLTTISFDIFVLETLLPLCKGLHVVLADPMNLWRDVEGYSLDMIQTTPSTMQLILHDRMNIEIIRKLSDIMLGGERFPTWLLQQLKQITDASIYNMYGPTETTIWSSIKDLTPTDEITVGRPIINTQLFVVDELLNLVPPDGIGELCISGLGLARGYLNRPELTEERFIQNPFIPEHRMYLTGDMARFLGNGEIELLGRIDNQVKVRGFRIELEEIEECLHHYPLLHNAVVAVKENAAEEKFLIVYYVADTDVTVTDIIAFLATSLPDYMIPGFYMRIDQIPLTPNGKIDRKALPEPDMKRPVLETEYIAPHSDLENQIADLWKQVLHCETVGIYDNFFELGGNSILLALLSSKLNDCFPEQISVTDIFSNPTIHKLTSFLQANTDDGRPEIKRISFPIDFYHNEENDEVDIELKITIETDIFEKLNKWLKSTQQEWGTLTLALYAHALSDISSQEVVGIMATWGPRIISAPIAVDFSIVSDLQDIMTQIDSQLTQIKPSLVPETTRDKRQLEEGRWIVPAYYYEQAEGSQDRSDASKLSLTVIHDLSGIVCKVRFSSGDLAKSKMHEFFSDYIRQLTTIADFV